MNLHSLVSAELVYRLGWTLLHSLWMGAAAALALAAVLALMDRRSAVARYGVAMGAMMMLIAGMGVAFAIGKAPAPPAAQSAIEARAESTPPSSVVSSVPVSDVDRRIQRQPWNGVERIGPEVEPVAQAAAGEGYWLRPALPWIAGGWAAGVVLLSLWQLGGWIAVQRLKVIGVEAVGREVEMMGRRLAERLGLSAAVRVVQSMRVETPLLVGWIRPVVLMPAAVLSGLTPRQLEAILAHELAHIRRHDYLINLFQVVAETLLFYHPAVWWISRRIRLEREQCCDDVAVGVCGDRHCYVESLAALEEVRLASPVVLAMSRSGSELLARIQRLLGMPTESRRRGAYGIGLCAALAILTAAFMAADRGRAAVSDVSSVTSRPVSGHTALSTKAAEARTPAQPSTRPAALPSTKPADIRAPQVIDIHLGEFRRPVKAERVIPYGSDIEFRWTVGKLSEPPGQFLLQVVPTFQGPEPPAGDDRKGWVVRHIPGDVRSLAYGRRWDGADTGAKDLLPGTYSVMLVAHSKADDEARNPIAITPVSFTIAPAPTTRPAGAVPAGSPAERPSTRAAVLEDRTMRVYDVRDILDTPDFLSGEAKDAGGRRGSV